ncbi:hypothetical protein [Clostridium sp. BL-8]|nr:hypothetical protein [Clostridium sp. BL-8]
MYQEAILEVIQIAIPIVIQVDPIVIQVAQEAIQAVDQIVVQIVVQDHGVIQVDQVSHIADHIVNHIADNI